MRTKEDENMQAYIAEQVSEILNERPRRKKAPARRALGGAALALLITILTVVVAVRALAVCDEPPAGSALPAATWTSVKLSAPETPEPTAGPDGGVQGQEDMSGRLNSRYEPVTAEEFELMARVVYAEANTESLAGQQAVAEVILNRRAAGNFQDSIYEVIYAPAQFSTAPMLEHVEPNTTNYTAVWLALYGEAILPADVVYFSRGAENGNIWGSIGAHVFCYQYKWG